MTQPGAEAHPVFAKQLVPSKDWAPRILRGRFSMGGIGYYLHSESGWHTRLLIHNYFSHLFDNPVPASWEAQLYSRDGTLLKRLEGTLNGHDTTLVELEQIEGLDPYGIVHAHLRLDSPTHELPQAYPTIFFCEYHVPGTNKRMLAHSLGAPTASHFPYTRISTGWVVPEDFRPFLFIANACRFPRQRHPLCGRVRLSFINGRKQELPLEIPAFGPLSCLKVDLFEMLPGLRTHISDHPFSIHVTGTNILTKPFLLSTDGRTTLTEHL